MNKFLATLSCLLLIWGCASDGADGGSCRVEEVSEGALVTCDDGSEALVPNGTDGANGVDGQDGQDGQDGMNGTNGANGADGVSCQTPVSTYYMMNYKLIATEERIRWLESARIRFDNCIMDGIETSTVCRENYLRSEFSAHSYYIIRGNFFPENECGARVMELTKTINEFVSEDGSGSLWSRNMEDTDGDGIANYHEFFMGLNPCTPQSFGCTMDADGDFDFDGVPNGEDQGDDYGPYCPADVSFWPAECI
ncbi:MAG: hypothetical protein OEY44_03425 [Candidatus Peregrinibacteria bacterium]|nr:hypothetical protein [Candidatus Peregrinibacteria bacterium]